RDASITEPRGENISFTGFDMDLSAVDSDIEYTAQYRNVASMEFASLPKTDYELNDRIDLRNGQVLVRYEDGKEQTRQLTTSNVSGYDMSVSGDQDVTVTSDGRQESFTINVSDEKDAQRAKIKDKILGMISYYSGRTKYTDDQVNQILEVKKEMDATVQPYLTQPDLRAFDTILRGAYRDKINYVVADNPYGLAVSGLSVSIPLEEGQLDRKEADEDSYRISIDKASAKTRKPQ
ncbi:MAG: bacterial Ig-like domain-containing protein, partial [Solobacterium sp.]|nr:bacterial Ig-like domain-containing protein [Solobacterium sp.]